MTKTHNYNIIKKYSQEEIDSHGDVDFFLDPEVTDKKIKLRRAKILNKIGHQCVEPGCKLDDIHFAVGVDNGGAIHLDLYGIDKEGELNLITIDHIKPKSLGGKNVIENYATLCWIHNQLKGSNYVEEIETK